MSKQSQMRALTMRPTSNKVSEYEHRRLTTCPYPSKKFRLNLSLAKFIANGKSLCLCFLLMLGLSLSAHASTTLHNKKLSMMTIDNPSNNSAVRPEPKTMNPDVTFSTAVQVKQLRCDYLVNPLGIDTPHPRLSWILKSNKRGVRQVAYQILVADTQSDLEKELGDFWNSGKVVSSATEQIRYSGKPLPSETRVFWKVRVWDQSGHVSESKAAYWEMGLLHPSDWAGAKWITSTTNINSKPAPYLRRRFQIDDRIRRARVYICGLGYYVLYLNGQKVGNHVLDPGYTRYDRHALYVTYNVTHQLRRGANAFGVILGNGWFNCQTKAVWRFDKAPWRATPRLRFELSVDYVDGRHKVIVSDGSWRCSSGSIRFDNIYSGEIFDARLETPDWTTAAYNDSKWDTVKIVKGPAGKLVAQMMPPIRICKILKPVKLTEPKPGVFVFDFSQNLAGTAQLMVSGPTGTRVTMRYGEQLYPNGTLDTRAIDLDVKRLGTNQPFQTDTYILRGSGRETWHARFSYKGFRYVQVTGFPGKPTLNSLQALFIHSDVPRTGVFTCSNPMLNKIQHATLWSYLSNLESIPTDCPTREKNGWTGDAQLACEQALFNSFPPTIYDNWINDMADEQKPNGELPGIVPTSGWGYGMGPAWSSAFLLIPYYEYEYYGDTQAFRRHYSSMKLYLHYLTSQARNGIVSIGLNDWAPWKTTTPAAITSTGYYYVDATIMALAARLLGKSADVRHYTTLARSIRKAFNQRFYNPVTGLYGNGSQTSLSCALYHGLVKPANKGRVVSNLVVAVKQSHYHIDTGILGAKYLLNTLLVNGYSDVAARIVMQKTEPGWGWWIQQGATTLWENWNGGGSHNHIMFGDVSAWFYKTLAGIQPDPKVPAFGHFYVIPHIVGGVTHARAEYNSIRGTIVSSWVVTNEQFELHLVVPPNTTATVSLPIINSVLEAGKPTTSSKGLTFIRHQHDRTVFKCSPGSYLLSGPLGLHKEKDDHCRTTGLRGTAIF